MRKFCAISRLEDWYVLIAVLHICMYLELISVAIILLHKED